MYFKQILSVQVVASHSKTLSNVMRAVWGPDRLHQAQAGHHFQRWKVEFSRNLAVHTSGYRWGVCVQSVCNVFLRVLTLLESQAQVPLCLIRDPSLFAAQNFAGYLCLQVRSWFKKPMCKCHLKTHPIFMYRMRFNASVSMSPPFHLGSSPIRRFPTWLRSGPVLLQS